jgi:hypothetical protein
MAKKLSRNTVSELMATWGRKGGSRATQAQKNAALENLKRTPNYRKHIAEGVTTTATTTTTVTPNEEHQ